MSYRNGLKTSIPELEKIIKELKKQNMRLIKDNKLKKKEQIELNKVKFELDIYNKTGFSDDWEFLK